MFALNSVFFGVVTAIASVLLHQSIPPCGLLISLLLTYFTIWYVGRYTGKKIYKVIASISWFAVIFRAGNYGVGMELLILGDGVGTGLLFLGLATIIAATLRKI